MTTRELDQLWERLDKLEAKVDRALWVTPLTTVAAAVLAVAAKAVGLL